jgi:hypothetical protein
MVSPTESLKSFFMKVTDHCVCFNCGQAKMKLYFHSDNKIGARCRGCSFFGIFLDGKLVTVSRKVFGQRLQEMALTAKSSIAFPNKVIGR